MMTPHHPGGYDVPTPTPVEIFVDPMCPFAWLTSRWLGEVERLGRIDLTIRIMSLSILNEDREDASEFYRDLVDRAWGPARLAIAIERDYGADALRRWYDELGRRIHTGGERIDAQLLAETLAATALPDTLLAEAHAGTAADRPASTRSSARAIATRWTRSATMSGPRWCTSSTAVGRSPSSDRSSTPRPKVLKRSDSSTASPSWPARPGSSSSSAPAPARWCSRDGLRAT